MRTMLAVLLAVAGAGCSETLPLHGDVTFTAEERVEIERGNLFVAEHMGRQPIVIIWDAPHVDGECEAFTVQRTPLSGGTSWLGLRCIAVGVAPSREGLAGLAAHEFGHWQGLDHVEHGLMQPIDPPLAWSVEDQAECDRSGLCH